MGDRAARPAARGHNGGFDFERAQGQDFVVHVLLDLDLATAAASDDVANTVHYGEFVERLVAVITGKPGRRRPAADQRPELPVRTRAHLRAFVLRPWVNIEPYGQLPGHRRLTDQLSDPYLAADLARTTTPVLPSELAA